MCGIVGYTGAHQEAVPIVLSALKRLEYRGYDSAGVAGLQNGSRLHIKRCEGKLDRLTELLAREPLGGGIAIGHTRWATHGRPSEKNAHPHRYRDVVIVHNGIIENYRELQRGLQKKKHVFESETDSEVIAHLLQSYIDETGDFEESCQRTVAQLEGAFAVVALWSQAPQKLFVAKQHCPLLLGLGEQENFVASDVPALLEYTRNFIFLDDGEMAFVEPQQARVYSFSGKPRHRKSQKIEWSLAMAEKEGYEHFMLKEIHEQPRVLRDTMRGRIHSDFCDVSFDSLPWGESRWKSFRSASMLGCGSAWHAGLLGKYWMEEIAKLPTEVDLASEFRYRNPVVSPKTLSLAITQSGETADTLAAIEESRKLKATALAVTNCVDSSVVRKAKNVIYMHAGPEISVASTKCFIAQMMVLLLISVKCAFARKTKPKKWLEQLLRDCAHLPELIEEVLSQKNHIRKLASRTLRYEQYFYIGRGYSFPLALEGALKLKEIAYINTQAYPGGEMKHGPIALINESWPVVCIAPQDRVTGKMRSNMEEVRARGGKLIGIGTEGDQELQDLCEEWISIPKVREELTPFLSVVALQLFAYDMSVLRGCDVDQPRNLAKSVTVE